MRHSAPILTMIGLLLGGCSGAVPLPAQAVALNRAGAEALARGDLETADARLSLALEYSPRFVEALVNHGLVELQRGNFERAREVIARARRLNPDVAQPHHALGVLAERQARPDDASRHYYDALAVDPGFAPARANLARLLFDAGMLNEAWVQFKRLVEAAPDSVEAKHGLAETLLRLGRVDEAEAVAREALEEFPDSPELVVLAARSQLRRGHFQRAIELLAPLGHGRDDVAANALGWLATAELLRGDARRAVGAAKRALELEPSSPVATYAMAQALEALGDPAALSWRRRARPPR
ncbi:MAG: domain protein putative component of TonB system [Polyangiaceae bacterium]|jgi:tetratricopeptide (TPR) repeat protein|nr:domain protein putative component of TonB system [Polyangiaceae bacterium]